jgi:DNA repair protein RadC
MLVVRSKNLSKRRKPMELKEINEKEVLTKLLHFTKTKGKKGIVEQLLNKFGSLKQVVDAQKEDLYSIVSEREVTLINFVKEFTAIYNHLKIKETEKVNCPQAVVDYLKAEMNGLKVEKMYVLLLNSSNHLIKVVELDEGIEHRSAVYPRKVARLCLQYYAVSVILAHNHPGGNLKPSQNDILATEAIHKALKTIDSYLLDHIIIADNDYYSFKDNNLL